MTQRFSEMSGPALRHTREYFDQLRELRYRHPRRSVDELKLFLSHLNNPPPVANAAPTASLPKPVNTPASRLWPHLSSSEEK
jgi:hypothetical protein